ncbi:chemotaxis protein CheA [Chakrabartia godavariana]|nr:chemotaxis protein CheA [Chakrabartia godavariana]
MQHDEIQQIFLLECDEGLDIAERSLLACKDGSGDAESINSIFRAVHSIKGGAGAFGFTPLQSFTHKFETVLQQVRDGDKPLTPGLLKTLIRAFDVLTDHVSAIKGQADAPSDHAISAELEGIATGEIVPEEDSASTSDPAPLPDAEPEATAEEDGGREIAANDDADIDFDALLADLDVPESKEGGHVLHLRPTARALDNGSDPILLLRELHTLGATVRTVDASSVPDLDNFAAESAYLGWEIDVPASVTRAKIDEIFDFIGDACDLAIYVTGEEPRFVEQADPTVVKLPEAAPLAPTPEPQAPKVEPAAAPVPAIASIKPEVAADPVSAAPAANAVNSAAAAAAPVATIRVDLDRLDRLVDTVGELVITQSMLAQRLSGAGVAAEDELSQLEYLTRELQDCAMALRAQPIRSVFSRVPRIVRELESETGKRVTLTVEGEATELDKTVIERIGEPLTHLIRNAIDHGLEPVEDRIAAGKAAEGNVRLSAEQRGGHILICVADDGRGIDRARVFQKAVERKIVAPDARLTDEEIDNLIFAPGFSTAEQVSNISGRGVGMDVVKQAIQGLGGRVSISSEPGKGTVFSLSLPLTLAIADGMIVSSGGETLILPLNNVVESLQAKPEDLKRLTPTQHVINVRGSYLPVVPLTTSLGIGQIAEDSAQNVLIVVETESYGQIAIQVDAIQDQRQVVIKSLETNFRPITGIGGATILGDGRIALIVDVEALAAAAHSPKELDLAA